MNSLQEFKIDGERIGHSSDMIDIPGMMVIHFKKKSGHEEQFAIIQPFCKG